ncbi:PilZ domain-containing protein [Desulfonema magnum]|uniref:PilZ domain-containing protein n=1 Tax=Desulfonema magnum TaxID=45655 RepID=A0A975GPD7_9BACT|nr:PilZ domain-containing protein [Desulfonema magnum]QTA88737.1 PilZ domain-containing protein [Desulfonema magnum]
MAIIPNRAFPRDHYEARITYAVYGTEKFIDAKMYNTSEGGMYFESDHNLPPGSELFIKLPDYSCDIHGSDIRDGYRGEVMWCRKIFKGDISCYAVGIRFIVNVCDKCGQKVSYSEIRRTDNFLFLCSACVKDVGRLSAENKKRIENYLMGNVI